MLVLFTRRGEGGSHLLFFCTGFFELLECFGKGSVCGFKAGLEHGEFVLGLPELFVECSELLCFFLLFLCRLEQSVVVEFNGYLEALDGLAEFGGLPSGELVDLLLEFGDFVVKFQ